MTHSTAPAPPKRVTSRPEVTYGPLHHLLLTHALYGGLCLHDGYVTVAGERWSHRAYLAAAELVFTGLLEAGTPDYLGTSTAVPTAYGGGVLRRWDAECGAS